MLIRFSLTALITVGIMQADGDILINFAPYNSNICPTRLSPDTMGENPDYIFTKKKDIKKLIKMITACSDLHCNVFDDKNIRFVFRQGKKVYYVDNKGVVFDGEKYWFVSPEALQKFLLMAGVPDYRNGKQIDLGELYK